MRILAISDIHINHPENRALIEELPHCPEDLLLLVGDVADRYVDMEYAFSLLVPRFRKIVWVPGNHDLWTLPGSGEAEKGVARYERLVAMCQSYGILTPEDPYPVVSVAGELIRIVPLFLLYDFSFRPAELPFGDVGAWAAEVGTGCTDDFLLGADPYPDCSAWCQDRCETTLRRLEACQDGTATILANHFPMVEEFAGVPLVPRFTPWCGTQRSADWHIRFRARVVVTGHLHMPFTRYKDGVRFEDVSLGYPRQRLVKRPASCYLRQILPDPASSDAVFAHRTRFH